MPDVDSIIIGAGHNGLAAGGILAKNGQRVLVLEKTNYPGGMAATKELFKGFKHSVGAWALIVFHKEMQELLEIDDFGYESFIPDTSYCVYGAPEDKPFIAYNDPIVMANKLATDHGPDAMRGLFDLFQYLQGFQKIADEQRFKNPDSMETLIAQAPDEETRRMLHRLTYGSAMDIIRDYFPDPEKHKCIQGSLAAMTIDGTHMGPYTPGSATSMAFHYTATDAMNVFKLPKGGIGALCTALVKKLEHYGGEVRYKSQVQKFLLEEGRVVGVQLRSGEKITANQVLSSLDAKSTFHRLTGEEHLSDDFNNKVDEIDYRNGYLQIHLTLKELPEFTGHLAFTNEDKLKWLMAYIPSPGHLNDAWKQYRKGEIPDDPPAYTYFPSMVDPTLAPAGYHTATIFSHYFPYQMSQDKHNEYKNEMAKRSIGQITKYAPNFEDAIVDKVVLTHQYFEKTFGITKGDFCHGLLAPGQMFNNRPVDGYANYRTPIDGLYMCGAGCHPGPGVTGVPGYNAAKAVLADSAAAQKAAE